MECVSSPVI